MCCCPFPIYICGIKFLIGCAICFVFGIVTKGAIVLSTFNFINCCDFMLIFSLTWDFITMLLTVDINVLTDSISAPEKILALKYIQQHHPKRPISNVGI